MNFRFNKKLSEAGRSGKALDSRSRGRWFEYCQVSPFSLSVTTFFRKKLGPTRKRTSTDRDVKDR